MPKVVYIAPLDRIPADGSMVDPALGRFWVSCQDDDTDGDPVLEEADVDGAEAAIAWAVSGPTSS